MDAIRSSRWSEGAVGLLLLLLCFIGALALRIPKLDQRPMHSDEGVNAHKFGTLWEKGEYRYDPHEFHGPTLPYLTWAIAAIRAPEEFADFQEVDLRVLPALVGAALILLLAMVKDGLGRAETVLAGLLLAISPAMVFYSRYYIHEILLVAFTFLFAGSLWRFGAGRRRVGWMITAGISLGLMHATKETFVLSLGAMVIAATGAWAWARWADRQPPADLRQMVQPRHVVLGILAALLTSLLFFTSFFSNASGPLDSVRTYLPWLNRAGGDSPHIHPWFFYLRRLVWFHYPDGPFWSEGLIFLLGLAGILSSFTRAPAEVRSPFFRRAVAIYAVTLTAVYSAIFYKTPWCALNFLHGWILLAGMGIVAVWRWVRFPGGRTVLVLLLALGVVHLGWQAWRASFPASTSRYNPHLYAHTSSDITNLLTRIEELADVHPDGEAMVIKVMTPAPWPLPWNLREYTRVGWWRTIPEDPWAPVMIASAQFDAGFDRQKDRTHLMAGYFQLRPETFLELYVDIELWKNYVMSRPPPDEEE